MGIVESKMCCFDNASVACNVPWAGLGGKLSWLAVERLLKSGTESKMYCFNTTNSFAPSGIVHVLKQQLGVEEAKKYWASLKVPQPFDRMAYHLFNAMNPWSKYGPTELFNESTVIG